MSELQLDFNKIVFNSAEEKDVNSEKRLIESEKFLKLSKGSQNSLEQSKPTSNRSLNIKHGDWSKMARDFIKKNNLTKENLKDSLEFKKLKNHKLYGRPLSKAIYNELNKSKKVQKVEPRKKESRSKLFSLRSLFYLISFSISTFLVFESHKLYNTFLDSVVVSVVLAILIELLVLIFSHLGKKSDLMLAFIVACFSVVSFSYITFATDSHRMNRVESAKEKKEILIESKMRAKKELAEVKKELHKLNSLFVWQSEKNFKTLALKKTQPLIDKKNQKKEVILAEIAAIDKKLLNSLDKNEETWTMTVGSWLFIVLKIILQISAMILLFRASKMKPTKKKAVV